MNYKYTEDWRYATINTVLFTMAVGGLQSAQLNCTIDARDSGGLIITVAKNNRFGDIEFLRDGSMSGTTSDCHHREMWQIENVGDMIGAINKITKFFGG